VYARVYGGACEALHTHSVQYEMLHALSPPVWDLVRIAKRILEHGLRHDHMIWKLLKKGYFSGSLLLWCLEVPIDSYK
jgi:hypothetical protein